MAHALTRIFDDIVDCITTNVTVKNTFNDTKISTKYGTQAQLVLLLQKVLLKS